MLAFLAGYVIGDKHLETRGVPEPLRARRCSNCAGRYSTRPGRSPTSGLVQELGLFRLSVAPAVDLRQSAGLSRAGASPPKAAGAERLMLTVSLACDPVRTVELFGQHVLPKL